MCEPGSWRRAYSGSSLQGPQSGSANRYLVQRELCSGKFHQMLMFITILQVPNKNNLVIVYLFQVNCRSSLEGVWQFAYQNRFRFTGECDAPDAQIRSCQTAGTQFLITNQKFNITYKSCLGMSGTFDGIVEYSCLGKISCYIFYCFLLQNIYNFCS